MKILVEKTDYDGQAERQRKVFNRRFWQGKHHQHLRQAQEWLIIPR